MSVEPDLKVRVLKSDKSASCIYSDCPDVFDEFAHICFKGTYIPNKRLQSLVKLSVSEHQIAQLQCALNDVWTYPDSFNKVCRKERAFVDPLLQLVLSTVFRSNKLEVLQTSKFDANFFS